ncbi:uncharacterized protein N7473_011063 [Penicillium subrubescens]|uniref:uncharacterized protein n=1 Tax=Penicillium subrubescens TaxID=1316194 RepID=UPI002544E22E|nr:uncharacterized protein N7473_011063 [Penicillium subrubescens]KAJ5882801.1 hypothetical protein N7473_011063 [Penicillium subrubescens]
MPKHDESNVSVEPEPLETVRTWLARPCPDIKAKIRAEGLDDAILEDVPLEGVYLADHISADSHIVVDLAVVKREIARVHNHFDSVPLLLDKLTLIESNEYTTDPGTPTQRKYRMVHRMYLSRHAKAKQNGKTPKLVLDWYQRSSDDMNLLMMQNCSE